MAAGRGRSCDGGTCRGRPIKASTASHAAVCASGPSRSVVPPSGRDRVLARRLAAWRRLCWTLARSLPDLPWYSASTPKRPPSTGQIARRSGARAHVGPVSAGSASWRANAELGAWRGLGRPRVDHERSSGVVPGFRRRRPSIGASLTVRREAATGAVTLGSGGARYFAPLRLIGYQLSTPKQTRTNRVDKVPRPPGSSLSYATPSRTASAAAAARFCTPSFPMIAATLCLTVLALMKSSWPIIELPRPQATSRSTSRSR